MIAFKDIKPARLKDDAFRLHLLNAIRKAGTEIKKDFAATTRTWEHQPRWEVLTSLTGPGPVVLVSTDDRIYGYVNNGTRPHDIWAGYYTGKSLKRQLAFRTGYTAKTKPGVLTSTRGGATGTMRFTPYAEHPGTEARKFDEMIEKKWRPLFKRRMEQAMRDGVKGSGHGM